MVELITEHFTEEDYELIYQSVLNRIHRTTNQSIDVQNFAIERGKLLDALETTTSPDELGEDHWGHLYTSVRVESLHAEDGELEQIKKLSKKIAMYINIRFGKDLQGDE